MTTATHEERMPAIYLSHGTPPLADDPVWPGELAAWSAGLPRPKAILIVSAHWEEAPLALGATTTVPLDRCDLSHIARKRPQVMPYGTA